MILLIDNYDSFTFNLFQQLESLGARTLVVAHDRITVKDIKKLKPSKIIISPGPKRPQHSGISMAVIKNFYKTTPILGVCLGHECIGEMFGSKTVHAKEIMHGKTSKIFHIKKHLFHGIPQTFNAARYNSLVINQVPDRFVLLAWDNNQDIMAIRHEKYPLTGVQFHPESFMTRPGDKLIRNFLNEN